MAHTNPAPTRRRYRTALCAAAVAGLAAALGGCNTTNPQFADYPTDYRVRHPITLREGPQTVEVFVSRGRGGLNPTQRADVMAFAQSWKHDATSGIVIDVPKGSATRLAAADSLREIHSILNASGVPASGVVVRSYQPASLALASIKISYAKLMAEAGPCGWPRDMGPTADPAYFDNRPYWNFGCANQRNLAAMVDNPADLVQPRGETPAYQARRTVAIDKYRKGEDPAGIYSGYDTGKISDVGK